MELKEIIRIIFKNKTFFLGIFLVIVFTTIGWLLFQPPRYQMSLAMDITRDSISETTQYQYDQYYRLLADEKFADTIVQWTRDPQIVKEVFDKAGVQIPARSLNSFSKIIKGEKRSSNFIQIRIVASNKEDAEKIASAFREVFSSKVEKINSDVKNKNWFKLNFGRAIVVEYHLSFLLVLSLSIIGGVLLAFLMVMSRYYWDDQSNEKDDQILEFKN